jgi:hypothetical protein
LTIVLCQLGGEQCFGDVVDAHGERQIDGFLRNLSSTMALPEG